MTKTSRDAQKHIREWSKFFCPASRDLAQRDRPAVAQAAVDEFLSRYKRRKHLKQSLTRLITRGFVKKRGGKLAPTADGIRFFRRHAGVHPGPSVWDGKWRLVTFDVPGNYNIARDRLRALLKEFDFYPLQKSVWVCPSHVSDEFWRLASKQKLDEYCKVMLVDIIEGDGELKKHFKPFVG